MKNTGFIIEYQTTERFPTFHFIVYEHINSLCICLIMIIIIVIESRTSDKSSSEYNPLHTILIVIKQSF